jgi:thiosulfate dehydrogenase (quinone) large subunit
VQTEINQQTQTPQATAPKKPEFSASLAVIPLRLFLGLAFIAAGIDKITDPEFFDPNAIGYIGTQLAGFANSSPLGGFLTNFAVPNAVLFGWMVVLGQLAIGLATLAGFLTRISAFFGLMLSLTLWLTATWAVQPFYFGSDLPFAIGWLTLLVAGAHSVYSVDGLIKQVRTANKPAPTVATEAEVAGVARRRFITVAGATFAAGTVTAIAWGNGFAGKSPTAAPVAATTPTTAPTVGQTQGSAPTTAPTSASASTTAASASTTAPATGATTAAPVATTAAPTSAPAVQGTVIATTAEIAVGASKVFTVPNTRNTAILVHVDDSTWKAYSNICTHQGCEVAYNASAKQLICPCHGARFDVSNGSVTRGPTSTPLAAFTVSVQGGNVVYTQK